MPECRQPDLLDIPKSNRTFRRRDKRSPALWLVFPSRPVSMGCVCTFRPHRNASHGRRKRYCRFQSNPEREACRGECRDHERQPRLSRNAKAPPDDRVISPATVVRYILRARYRMPIVVQNIIGLFRFSLRVELRSTAGHSLSSVISSYSPARLSRRKVNARVT